MQLPNRYPPKFCEAKLRRVLNLAGRSSFAFAKLRLALLGQIGMDLRTFGAAFTQIAKEKGIPEEKVLEVIEQALAAAYKRDYAKRTQQVRVKFDPEAGKLEVWQVLLVVDPEQVIMPDVSAEASAKAEEKPSEAQQGEASPEARSAEGPPPKTDKVPSAEGAEPTPTEGRGSPDPALAGEGPLTKTTDVTSPEEEKIRFNPDRHIVIAEARKIKQDIQVGEELLISLEPHYEFGRIAAQTAKQVIIQRLREAERDAIVSEYTTRVGELVSGIIQRVESRTVYIDLGRTIGQLFPQDQIPRESYRVGERLRFYLAEVLIGERGPQIVLSRSHPKFVTKLFELEVPEVSAGTVVIKAIAREAGSRTKIAVASLAEGVDPIGSCVGQRGTRVMTVIGELGGEKIDVIQWNEEPGAFIAKALAPAKVSSVELAPRTTAIVMVPSDQLSLAIGKEGQNVRLAAKLTGWKIDIRGEAGEKVEGGEALPDAEQPQEGIGESQEAEPEGEAAPEGEAKSEDVKGEEAVPEDKLKSSNIEGPSTETSEGKAPKKKRKTKKGKSEETKDEDTKSAEKAE